MRKSLAVFVILIIVFSFLVSVAEPVSSNSETAFRFSNQKEESAEVQVDESIALVTNDLISRFVTEYNAVADFPLHDFSRGNIRTKYFAYANDCWIEMIDATDSSAGYFSITINGGHEDKTVQKMLSVLPNMLSVLNKSLNAKQINDVTNKLKSKTPNKEIILSPSLKILYYPVVKLSFGTNNARIEIQCSNYK